MSLAISLLYVGFFGSTQMHPFLIFLDSLHIYWCGASGAINMWYDKDIDGLMVRTRGRPIPQGKISALDALGFGIILALVSVLILGLAVSSICIFIVFLNLFYVFIYTIWLKRRTPQNIVIGGAAGAFPL